jgi:hypothetical protein
VEVLLPMTGHLAEFGGGKVTCAAFACNRGCEIVDALVHDETRLLIRSSLITDLHKYFWRPWFQDKFCWPEWGCKLAYASSLNSTLPEANMASPASAFVAKNSSLVIYSYRKSIVQPVVGTRNAERVVQLRAVPDPDLKEPSIPPCQEKELKDDGGTFASLLLSRELDEQCALLISLQHDAAANSIATNAVNSLSRCKSQKALEYI